jgi:hypothetical protein
MKAFNSKEVLGGEGNPCAVMHVRRGDILLHDGQSRFFLSVANYVHAGRYYLDEFGIKTIFLLTDSQMAIDEALRCEKEYPEICAGINWRYLDKKRWLAGEGGWENPFPSGSSVEELYNIQLEFALAQSCEFTIFGESGYSERVYYHMCCGFPLGKRGILPHRCSCPPRIKVDQANFGCEDGNEALCRELHNGKDPKDPENNGAKEFALSPKAYRNSTRVFFSPSMAQREYGYSLNDLNTPEVQNLMKEKVIESRTEICTPFDNAPQPKSFCRKG